MQMMFTTNQVPFESVEKYLVIGFFFFFNKKVKFYKLSAASPFSCRLHS